MKIGINLIIKDDMIVTREDLSKVIRLISGDIEQGASSGFIRNNKTGSESNQWFLEIKK